MQNFVFSYPTKTYFGQGAAGRALPEELKKYGPVVMLAYGGGSIKKNGVYDEMTALLRAAGKEIVEFPGVMPNPTYAKVQEGARLARERRVEFILAVGGGSVSDCCKIVSAQALCNDDIWEKERNLRVHPTDFIPMGVVVTVAGTGSEQNDIAVITNEALKIKCGLIGAHADFAVLDPAYTMSAPLKQVMSGAFDTLSHCMETYFGTPLDDNLSDEINEAVMRSVIKNMRALAARPDDQNARGELMWASAMAENGVLKIGKAVDFQAHQIEHQVGAYTNCNHGMGLAAIHPVLYRHIYKGAPERFARFARSVWNVTAEGKTDGETSLAGIQALQDFIAKMGLPVSFRKMGLTDKSFFKPVAESVNIKPSCCRQLSRGEIFDILQECW